MATDASKVRIVRCPKCSRLLTEFADVPVYKCGGCGTLLRAKNQHAKKGSGDPQMIDRMSSEKNILQHVSESAGSSNDLPTLLNNQDALLSSNSNTAEMDDVGEHKHIHVPSEKPSSSGSENNYDKEEESSECTENGNMEPGLTDDKPSSTEHPGMIGNDTMFAVSDQQGSIRVDMDSCSDELLDDSWKVSEHGSVNSCSSCKIDVKESSFVSEDRVDGYPGNISSEMMNAPTARSTHAYDGNDHSHDDISNTHDQCLLSSSAVTDQTLSVSNNAEEKNGKEDTLLENLDADSIPHLKSTILSSNSSDKRCASLADFGGSDTKRTSSNHAYYRENSQRSEIFYSARRDLEDDSLSSSLSRDSSFKNLPRNSRNDIPTRLRNVESDRMELLRKVDELRDRLTRPCAQEQRGNQRFHIRGTNQDGRQPLFYTHGSEQVRKCCNSNISQSHSRCFGQQATAQLCHPLRVHFSGQGNSSCLHHHPEDWCIPVPVSHNICCGAHTCHVFCPPSTAASCNVTTPCSHSSQTSAQHFEKPHCKEKRHPLKRYCRPVSGGAPFVICNNCLRLLQLPVDFLVSRARYHKLKCGNCSEVLIFLSLGGGHIVPHSDTLLDPAPSEIDNATEHVRTLEPSVDRSCAPLQGDPVSYSEEYGPPFSNGYSTDGDPVPHILRNSLRHNRRRGKLAIGFSLHQLMGYDSATELIYQPSDDDEAYETGDLATFHRTSNGIHYNEEHGRAGLGSSPHHEHSEIRGSPEHTGMHKQDGSIRRSTNPRGGSPLRGLLKKGKKELNLGLENMKLKLHPGGRVIPAP